MHIVPETGGYQSTIDVQPRDYIYRNGQWVSGDFSSYHNSYVYPEGNVYPDLGNAPITQFKVPFSASKWTWIYFEFTIPDTWYYFRDGSPPVQISIAAPWIHVRELTDGVVWFADSVFYINP